MTGSASSPAAARRFFLPVRVLSRLFRRLVLERLAAAYGKGLLILQGGLAKLAPAAAFAAALKPLRWKKWFVYAKRAVRGAEGGARLSVALHPPGRVDIQRKISTKRDPKSL